MGVGGRKAENYADVVCVMAHNRFAATERDLILSDGDGVIPKHLNRGINRCRRRYSSRIESGQGENKVPL